MKNDITLKDSLKDVEDKIDVLTREKYELKRLIASEGIENCEICGAYGLETQKYKGKHMCFYCLHSDGQDIDVKKHINHMMNVLEKRIVDQVVERLKGE